MALSKSLQKYVPTRQAVVDIRFEKPDLHMED
jgi:hypothetical protein